MVKKQTTPLTQRVPIVNTDGTPTLEFMIKWSQQQGVNASVPELSNAAQMSHYLDLIGTAEGALLRRGAEQWQALLSPGGTSKYLRADGTYGGVPIVTGTAPGLAPKLSKDASTYLDGSGQWSVPAGGGSSSLADILTVNWVGV